MIKITMINDKIEIELFFEGATPACPEGPVSSPPGEIFQHRSQNQTSRWLTVIILLILVSLIINNLIIIVKVIIITMFTIILILQNMIFKVGESKTLTDSDFALMKQVSKIFVSLFNRDPWI